MKVKEHTAKVPFPKLSLEDDVEGYFIETRLSGDGKFPNRVLEYIAQPYVVRKK